MTGWNLPNWFLYRNKDACNPELYVWLLQFSPFLPELCQTQQSRQLLSPCFLPVPCINIIAGRLRSLAEYTVQNGTIPQRVNNKRVCEHSTLHLQTTATNAGVRFPAILYLPAEVMKMCITFFHYATVTRTTIMRITFLHYATVTRTTIMRLTILHYATVKRTTIMRMTYFRCACDESVPDECSRL
jgi:hypothetical protein